MTTVHLPLLDTGKFHANAELSTTLPSHWYFDRDIYQLEHESIFFRNWWYQCHVTDISASAPGYYASLAGRSIEIKLSPEGLLQAFSSDKPIRLENYGGFLFVNFDHAATPLVDQAPQFLSDMYECCPKLDQLTRVRRFEREIAANWKTLVDNNHECYHCALNHKSLMQLVDYENQAVWTDDGITFSHTVRRKQLDNPAYSLIITSAITARLIIHR